jgi:hypothetical protein
MNLAPMQNSHDGLVSMEIEATLSRKTIYGDIYMVSVNNSS